MTQRITKWATRIVWCLAFCAFVFSWFHAPFDNSPIQFESAGIFLGSLGVAVTVTLLCWLTVLLAKDNWRFSISQLVTYIAAVLLVLVTLWYTVLLVIMGLENYLMPR